MIQLIGLIVAVYCMARLLQVPVERIVSNENRNGMFLLAGVSGIGIFLIGVMAMQLLYTKMPSFDDPSPTTYSVPSLPPRERSTSKPAGLPRLEKSEDAIPGFDLK